MLEEPHEYPQLPAQVGTDLGHIDGAVAIGRSGHLPPRFRMNEEWYNFKSNPRSDVNVLISIDEGTYDPGLDGMGDHPISWSHAIDGGRAWYTNIGHSVATYRDPAFKQHLLGGILWVTAGM